MWLSKITYDLVAARKKFPEFLLGVQAPISAKRIQLQEKYGGGDGVAVDWAEMSESDIPNIELQAKYGGGAGVAVNWIEVLQSDISTVTIIRSWPIKLAAQEHVDFAIFQADYYFTNAAVITATVEEQV